MKTAISVPDNIFTAADQYAKSHGVSRSQLYTKAVALFLKQHHSGSTTKQLNKVYSTGSEKLDATLSAMQFSSLKKEEW